MRPDEYFFVIRVHPNLWPPGIPAARCKLVPVIFSLVAARLFQPGEASSESGIWDSFQPFPPAPPEPQLLCRALPRHWAALNTGTGGRLNSEACKCYCVQSVAALSVALPAGPARLRLSVQVQSSGSSGWILHSGIYQHPSTTTK